MNERKPAEVFPPGDIIREELDARGWTQVDLAEILGVSVSGVNEILNDRRGLTAEIAQGLAEALGTSAQSWLNLDARYRLHRAEPRPGTRLRSQIYAKAPVREMIKRRWIEGSSNPEVLASTVCSFLGISSLDEEPKPFSHAARKATAYGQSSPGQVAWLCRVAQLAPAVSVAAPYDPARLPELTSALRALAPSPPEIRRIPRLLADYGIRFLVVEALPGSKIDGVAYWMDRRSPVVAMSLRYGKLNNFWHTFLHELAHLSSGDGKVEAVVDEDLESDGADLPPEEQAANRFAVETLIPAQEMEGFIDRVGPAYSLNRIQGFASRVGVHPAVVVGQLAHRGEITWARFGTHLPNVRDYVTSTALTDGWGHTLPPMRRGVN